MLRILPSALGLVALGALAGCNPSPSGGAPSSEASDSTAASTDGVAAQGAGDPFASRDPAPGTAVDPEMADDVARPLMQAQVVLERLGFAPGVIDDKVGLSTRNAVSGFQEANNLKPSGELDEPTKAALARWSNIPATRVVTIPADFAAGPFAPLPKEPADQAKLPQLGYASLEEKLAERFHTTPAVLKMLNPSLAGTPASGPAPAAPSASPSASPSPSASAAPLVSYTAGQQIRVPNVGADALDMGAVDKADWAQTLKALGVGNAQPKAAEIVVSKKKGTLKAYDEAGKLVALFTVTTGSSRDPLPLGTWKINGTSYNPEFSYDPSLFWDVSDDKGEHMLPPGPNGPVGVVWIDISKPHYGIHGTPSPETIGRAESHGCVRLTNWDAARLAQMVSGSTKVLFEA